MGLVDRLMAAFYAFDASRITQRSLPTRYTFVTHKHTKQLAQTGLTDH